MLVIRQPRLRSTIYWARPIETVPETGRAACDVRDSRRERAPNHTGGHLAHLHPPHRYDELLTANSLLLVVTCQLECKIRRAFTHPRAVSTLIKGMQRQHAGPRLIQQGGGAEHQGET
jgi:hypothetical protein